MEKSKKKNVLDNQCMATPYKILHITIFVVLIVSLLSTMIVTTTLTIIDNSKYLCLLAKRLDTASQIVTTVLTAVVSLLILAITIQSKSTEESYGLTLKQVNLLKLNPRFPITVVLLIIIAFPILNAFCMVFQCPLMCLGTLICSSVFSLYIVIVEVPYFNLPTKLILFTIKQYFVYAKNKKDIKNRMAKEQATNNAIKYLLKEVGIIDLCKSLSTKNSISNKEAFELIIAELLKCSSEKSQLEQSKLLSQTI